MYTVGNRLSISLFGRSHADCVGCVIEGLPMGMPIDEDHIRKRITSGRGCSSGNPPTA